MGLITSDYIPFKSAEHLFGRIKRRLKGFGIVGLIDENGFPEMVATVLNLLGISVFEEKEVLLPIKNKEACMPKDFKFLHAAYKCQNTNNTSSSKIHQGTEVITTDITREIFERNDACNIVCDYNHKILERVTLSYYVNDVQKQLNFKDPTLLVVSPNVRSKCAENCLNVNQSGVDEITFDKGRIYTNLQDDDMILFKYYALPLDSKGLPQIPDIQEIENAIEYYILWQLFMDMWLTDDIQNAAQKMQYLELKYNEYMASARYYLKLPEFSRLINNVRNKKGINYVMFFSQMQ